MAHDGSVSLFHSMVDSIAEAGADIVKFQIHVANQESTLDEPFRDSTFIRDKTRFEYWQRTEFNLSQWEDIVAHIRDRGLEPVASTFSPAGMDVVSELGLTTWKIGSAESRQPWFVKQACQRANLVIASTGMSNWGEIDQMVSIAKETSTPVILLQCTSKYPSPAGGVGINVLDQFQRRYNVPVGLSDHSGSLIPSLVALSHGAAFVEVHVTYSRSMAGPDSASSLSFEDLAALVDARDQIVDILKNPVDKDAVAESLSLERNIFGRSLALTRRVAAGETISADMLIGKKPGGGIPVSEIETVAGSVARRNLSPQFLLKREDYTT